MIRVAGNGRRARGFTLLEVLLGTGLLGVMMLLLFGSLRVCVQNWDAGEKKIAQVNQMAVIQRFFNAHLQGIRPLYDRFSEEEAFFSFQGAHDQLQFVSAMPASAGRMGLQSFLIGLAPGARKEGKDLLVSITPFFPLLEGKQWDTEQVVILEGIKAVRFFYFGAEQSEEPPVWTEQWLERQELPRLIGITIEMMDGEVWPEIVVAPKAEPDRSFSRQVNSGPGSGTLW